MRSLAARRPRPARAFRVGQDVVDVHVRESARARRVRIVVGDDPLLQIVVPRALRDRELDRLLESKRAWIESRLAEAMRPAELGLDRPGHVVFAGSTIPLEWGGGERARAALRDGRLVVSGPVGSAPAALARWYGREARRVTCEAVEREAARLGVRPGAISIRDQRTRWGSCSRRGDLSFSWRLCLAPPPVLEYVVVHELCHLRELNHSPAFWRLVEAALPEWRVHARWLRAHGRELRAYRPGASLSQA
jgi:predicted metal-dependent hydrolase